MCVYVCVRGHILYNTLIAAEVALPTAAGCLDGFALVNSIPVYKFYKVNVMNFKWLIALLFVNCQ